MIDLQPNLDLTIDDAERVLGTWLGHPVACSGISRLDSALVGGLRESRDALAGRCTGFDSVQNRYKTAFVPVDPATVLRDHAVQVTAQRLAVFRAVNAHPHSTANEVAHAVRSEIGAISQQSVYDTLTVLAEHDIIRRIQPAGSPTRYEGRVGDNHHHLICQSCDRLVDVDCAVGETPCLTPAEDWQFDVHEAEVIYWGTCPECRASDT